MKRSPTSSVQRPRRLNRPIPDTSPLRRVALVQIRGKGRASAHPRLAINVESAELPGDLSGARVCH